MRSPSQSKVRKPVFLSDADEVWVNVPAEVGDVRVLLIKPRGADGRLPAVVARKPRREDEGCPLKS